MSLGKIQAINTNDQLSCGTIVAFEDQGENKLAIISALGQPKLTLCDELGVERKLTPDRLIALGRLEASDTLDLAKLRSDALATVPALDIEKIWQQVRKNNADYSLESLAHNLYGDYNLRQITGLRLRIGELPFFKRKKNSYFPRSAEQVKQLKGEKTKKDDKQKHEKAAIAACKKKILDPENALPRSVKRTLLPIKLIASEAKRLPAKNMKDAKRFFNELKESLGLSLDGPIERQAYSLLRKLGEFDSNTNLALFRHNIATTFSNAEKNEAAKISQNSSALDANFEDLTDLLTFTIDDSSTMDMDDALSFRVCESGFELGVHISNVAACIPFDSVLEKSARRRGTSVYLTDRVIPMLPEELSNGSLSLVEGEKRPVLSIIFTLSAEYEVLSSRITAAIIKVDNKLSYSEVDQQLESTSGMLLHLYQAACVCEERRFTKGGFKLAKHDSLLRIDDSGKLCLEPLDENSPARMLISEMMILANETFAKYAVENNIPVFFRTQPAPDQEKLAQAESIHEDLAREYTMRTALKPSSVGFSPGLHSTLGITTYSQVTSPLRRYNDLCNQRQIFNFLVNGEPLYSETQLQELMDESNASSQYSSTVQKESQRFWYLKYLQQEKDKDLVLHATVLRNDMKSLLIQIHDLYMTTLYRSNKKREVGDVLKLKIAKLSPTFNELLFEEIE